MAPSSEGARQTIYRTLLSLTEAGVLIKTQLGDNVWRFELPRSTSSEHGTHPQRLRHCRLLASELGRAAWRGCCRGAAARAMQGLHAPLTLAVEVSTTPKRNSIAFNSLRSYKAGPECGSGFLLALALNIHE